MSESTVAKETSESDVQRKYIAVTWRQVRAAQIAVKGHKKLGRPVPPGLQRIADTKPAP